MKIYEFPYRVYKGLLLPLIPLTLNKIQQTTALIDSGATVSLFETSIGEAIGLDIEKGKRTYLTGIGGRILAYEHIVRVKVVDVEFPLKIAFSHELKVSVNLLGQDNFFDKFVITFDKSKHGVRLALK